jgi:hypothetical protein
VNALSAEADAHAVLSIQRPARQQIKPPIAPPADEVIERLAHARNSERPITFSETETTSSFKASCISIGCRARRDESTA